MWMDHCADNDDTCLPPFAFDLHGYRFAAYRVRAYPVSDRSSQYGQILKKMYHLVLFFCIAYSVSWIIWLPLYLPNWGITALTVLSFIMQLFSCVLCQEMNVNDLTKLNSPVLVFLSRQMLLCMKNLSNEQEIKISDRKSQIMADFMRELDQHLTDLKEGKAEKTLEINDLANILHIHPTHLSNTIKEATGKSSCDFYEEKLMEVARQLLSENDMPIGDIAYQLTFDPSNFTKFFKHFQGMTPKEYMQANPPKSSRGKK